MLIHTIFNTRYMEAPMKVSKSICAILVTTAMLGVFTFTTTAFSADKDVFIKIATGNTGGTYYPVGVGFSQLLAKENPGFVSSAMSTGGSVDNIGLLRSGDAQIAIIMSTVANWAYFGESRFKDKQYKDLRAISALWSNQDQIVVHKDIKSFEDLKGKRFVVGAARSGTETDSYAILSSAGLYYREDDKSKNNIDPIWLNYAESVESLKNRQADGGLFNPFPPASAVSELMATGDFHILQMSDELLATLSKNYPLFAKYTIEAGTYPNQPEDIQVSGYPVILMCSAQEDEDVIYKVTKTLFENPDYLAAIHQATKLIKPETAQQGVRIPFHDGAKKYLEEKGFWKQ